LEFVIYLKFGAWDLEFYSIDTLRYYILSAGIISRRFILQRDHVG